MKKNSGLTLLELLIAMTVSAGIILFTGSVFLSAHNLTRNMINNSKSHRSAQIAFMHIQKNIKNAACVNIYPSPPSISNELLFNCYAGSADVYSSPSVTSKYAYLPPSPGTPGQIRYYPDRNVTGVFEIVASHISSCAFTLSANNINAGVQITALDDNDTQGSECTFSGNIELMCGPSQPVFTI